MEDFIEKVSTIDQIDSLRLGSSNIKNLPSTLYKLNFLDYLNFANNKIKNIEEQQKQLVVSELDLSDNKIKSADVLGTSSIKRLDLTYNPFSAFPYCLGKVMELEVLQIGNWKKKLKINKGIQGFENLKWLTYLISYDRMNLRNDYFINNTEFQITNFRV
jgi:Leucine-rich repeat (LRR) protein